jgi:hypothetical protein
VFEGGTIVTNVIDKVRKLLALSTSSNVNEAAAAAAAAERLIEEHNIAEADLEAQTEAPPDPATAHEEPLAVYGPRTVMWRACLGNGLALLHGCRTVRLTRHERVISIIFGRKADVDTVRYLFAWLDGEIKRLVDIHGEGMGRSWRDSYCFGAQQGAIEAMRGAQVTARRAATSSALAVIDDRKASTDLAVAAVYPKLGPAGTKRISNGTAAELGRSHGRGLQAHRGIGAASTTKRLGS